MKVCQNTYSITEENKKLLKETSAKEKPPSCERVRGKRYFEHKNIDQQENCSSKKMPQKRLPLKRLPQKRQMVVTNLMSQMA